MLHPEGEVEMMGIAERFQARFPDLLKSNETVDRFRFRSTSTERAVRSRYVRRASLSVFADAQKVPLLAQVLLRRRHVGTRRGHEERLPHV